MWWEVLVKVMCAGFVFLIWLVVEIF